jgi:hypothetical protein
VADQLKQIVAFSSRRYNENRATRPGLARAHLAIINRAKDVQLSTGNVGDLLDFLSKPQTDPDQARACKELLKHIGAAPGS